MQKLTGAMALSIAIVGSAVITGCASTIAGPEPSPRDVAETSAPGNADWATRDLTMAAGAELPDGLDTLVVNNFTGSDVWELMDSQEGPIHSYKHVTNGCVASHGVLDLRAERTGDDLQASADFLGDMQGQDLSDVEPTMFEMPFVTDVFATVSGEPGELDIEMAGYPAAGADSVTIWGARAVEAVGKGFVFALTCPTEDDLGSIWEETKELVSFGVYDPTAAELGG